MIHLEDINPGNWREELQVAPEQRNYVSDSCRLLARAYAYREFRSRAEMIYDDEVPVGMLLFYDCGELGGYDFSQLFIAERYQRRGYGIQAAKLALEWMKNDGKYDRVYLCYIEGNEGAREMYTKLGFRHTGERDGNEIIMVRDLR